MLFMADNPDRRYALPPRRTVTASGVEFSLLDSGDGEAVLLLHGYPQSLLMWRHQIPVLAKSFRVIAPDWTGWGRSPKSFDVRARYWDEVHRLADLLDALDIQACNLIGHDYGGYLALGFVTRYPEHVSRLGIINSRAHHTFPLRTYIPFALLCQAARVPLLRSLAARLPWYEMTKTILRPYLANGSFDEALLEHYLGWMKTRPGRAWLIHFFRDYEMPARRELVAGLKTVAVPSAVIWGDRDPFCPWATATNLAARLPTAELVRLPGTDHYSPEEEPAAVTSAIRELLSRPTRNPATTRAANNGA